jgi:di/tricarboxylate transporter
LNLDRFRGTALTRALFWAAALFALVMALLPHPPPVPGNPSDKVQHVTAFAVLALLGRFAFPRLTTLRLIIALSLFGAFIEVAQAIPVLHRDSDPLDWVADTLACGIVLVGIAWWRTAKR